MEGFLFFSNGQQMFAPMVVSREDARALVARLNEAEPKAQSDVYSRWFTNIAERRAEEDREREIQRRKDAKTKRQQDARRKQESA